VSVRYPSVVAKIKSGWTCGPSIRTAMFYGKKSAMQERDAVAGATHIVSEL
jgi:hypothetical protein